MHKIHALKTAIAAIKNGILHLSPNGAHLSTIEDSLKIELPYHYAVPIEIKLYQLANLFANCPDDAEWSFNFDSGALELKSANWEARIPVESNYPERSPEQLVLTRMQVLRVPAGALKAAFERVRYAIAGKESPTRLEGKEFIHLFYTSKDFNLWVTGTDGFRMAMEAVAANSEEDTDLSLDPNLLEKVLALLPDTEIAIAIGEDWVEFSSNGIEVRCPKGKSLKFHSTNAPFAHLEGFFTHKDYTAHIDREKLLNAALRAETIPTPEIFEHTLLDIADGELTVCKGHSGNSLFFRERIGEVSVPDITICFQSTYLVETLKAAHGEIIAMRFSRNTDPVTWESGDLRQLLMPVRVLQR